MEKGKIYRAHWSSIFRDLFSDTVFIFCGIIYISKHINMNPIIISIIGIILFLIINILRWKSKYFYIENNDFIYVQGIISKTKKQIPMNKITTVDINEKIMNRILGSAILRINTGNATADEAEFMMNIKKDYALLIKNKVNKNKANKNEEEEELQYSRQDVLGCNEIKVSYKELVLYTLTKNKFSWMLILVVIGRNFSEYISDNSEKYVKLADDYIKSYSISNLALISIGILLAVYLISTILSMIINILKYGNFTISKDNNNVNIKYGLLNIVEYSIALDKIQGIKLKQNLFQQVLNLYQIEAIVAGADINNSLLFPIVDKDNKEKFIKNILTEYITNLNVNKAPRRALRKFIIKRSCLCFIILTTAILLIRQMLNTSNLIDMYMNIVLIIVLIFQIIFGYINYLNNGIGISDSLILLANGSTIKKTYIIKKSKIQSLQIQQSFFQSKMNVYDYKIDVATNYFGETINIKNMTSKMFNNILS